MFNIPSRVYCLVSVRARRNFYNLGPQILITRFATQWGKKSSAWEDFVCACLRPDLSALSFRRIFRAVCRCELSKLDRQRWPLYLIHRQKKINALGRAKTRFFMGEHYLISWPAGTSSDVDLKNPILSWRACYLHLVARRLLQKMAAKSKSLILTCTRRIAESV